MRRSPSRLSPSYPHNKSKRNIPSNVCRLHLSEAEKAKVTVVNEGGEEYLMYYFVGKGRKEFARGWRRFSKANNLCAGDVLIFQLIRHFKFKVYIVRTKGSAGAESTSDAELDSCAKQTNYADGFPRTPPEHIPKENVQKMASDTDVGTPQSQSDTDDFALDSEEGHVTTSVPVVDFKEVKSFEGFTIVINGLNIDAEVSEQDKRTYYNLCFSQRSYLHDHLLEDVNTSEWAATIISKTVKIADAIKTCQLSTPRGDFETWDKILNSFELLGMKVGFLRARLKHLLDFAFESEGAEILRRQVERREELSEAEENIHCLELEISALEEKKIRLDMWKEKKEALLVEMEAQDTFAKKYEDMFREAANAEW